MAAMLRTVLGDVEPSTMGATLPHEHVLVDLDQYWNPAGDPMADSDPSANPRVDNLWHWRECPCANRGNLHMNDERDAIAELKTLRDWGIGTLVEVTPIGSGRDVMGLRRVSKASGVHVVAGSSFYLASGYTAEVTQLSDSQLVDRLVRDITVGVDDTGIRAGIIGEVGLSWPLDPFEERSLAAAVRAHLLTGAAVTVHCPYYMRDVDVLQQIAQRIGDLGAEMSRVILGHCDSFVRDPRFLQVVGELGCCIELDLFGQTGYEDAVDFVYPSDEVRVEAILGMIDAGLADKLFLSHDVAFKTSMQTHGGHGYAYVHRVIIPWLKRMGASEDALDQILVRNAQRVLPIESAAVAD
jgi:phosphotriesterase-related protein